MAILVTVLDDARHLAICPIDRCAQGGGCGKWAKTYLTKSMILDFIARRALANDRLFDRMTRARQRDGRVIRRYWSVGECGLGVIVPQGNGD